MTRASSFLRQHVIALLALTLVVGGGAAFAAGTQLPKNSVGSGQVKNNALTGKDLKDKSVTGTDLKDGSVTALDLADGSVNSIDLADGGVTGTDLADGTVQKQDLAPGAVDEERVFYTEGGVSQTIWEEVGVGKATLGLSCDASYGINAFAAGALSPTRVGLYGIELRNPPPDTNLLVGSASYSDLTSTGQPTGGAGFGGFDFGYGKLVYHFQTPKKDVYIDLNIALCKASGTITIDNKPEGSVITRPAGSKGATTPCEASGDAYCTQPE